MIEYLEIFRERGGDMTKVLNKRIDKIGLSEDAYNLYSEIGYKVVGDFISEDIDNLLLIALNSGNKRSVELFIEVLSSMYVLNAKFKCEDNVGRIMEDLGVLLLSDDIERLYLPVKYNRFLRNNGIFTIGDLLMYTRDDLLALDGFGNNCKLNFIELALYENGFLLVDKIGGKSGKARRK